MGQHDVWDGDLLDREKCSRFLYNYVLHKSSLERYSKEEALCFAIDAEWGAGKSFFLNRWAQDLRNSGHAVIEFDAWANDLSEDPLLGFMAELRDGLQEWTEKLPPADRAPALMSGMLAGFRRAFWPTVWAVAKGYAENRIGKDTIAGIIEGDLGAINSPDGAQIAAGMDKYLEKALDEHKDIKKAVADFKKSLQALLIHLAEKRELSLPLFVIVDELDRCRPSYAIRLLEGIKHLFGAPNVCFVLSTNLRQMSESVRAVYGAGFDGRQYLKRFFAFEYELPTPIMSKLCASYLHPLEYKGVEILSDLPTGKTSRESNKEALTNALEVTVSAFDLKPRAIAQVVSLVDAVLTGSKHKRVHAFYLFFLAALLVKAPEKFKNFRRMANSSPGSINELLSDGIAADLRVSINSKDKCSIFAVLRVLLSASDYGMDQAISATSSSGGEKYPESLRRFLAEGYITSKGTAEPIAYIGDYEELLLQAGFLSSNTGL